MVAIHILHKLVHIARLFMKMASRGFVFQCLSLPESLLIALRRRNVVFRAVPEPNLLWSALRPVRRLLVLSQVLPCKIRQVCSISVLSFGKLATIRYELFFPGAASDGPCFSEAGDVSTEAEVRHLRRRKQAVITFVLLRCRVRNQAQLMLEATSGAVWCWSRTSTMVILNSNEDTWGLVPCGFLICWIV